MGIIWKSPWLLSIYRLMYPYINYYNIMSYILYNIIYYIFFLIFLVNLICPVSQQLGQGSSSHLLDGLKGASISERKLLTSLVSSTVRALPGSLWLALSGGKTPLCDSGLLQDRWLAEWMGLPFGSRVSASSWQGPSISRSLWEEDCTIMWGMDSGEEGGSLWDNCSFFMWWTTEAAWKACCWKCVHKERRLYWWCLSMTWSWISQDTVCH